MAGEGHRTHLWEAGLSGAAGPTPAEERWLDGQELDLVSRDVERSDELGNHRPVCGALIACRRAHRISFSVSAYFTVYTRHSVVPNTTASDMAMGLHIHSKKQYYTVAGIILEIKKNNNMPESHSNCSNSLQSITPHLSKARMIRAECFIASYRHIYTHNTYNQNNKRLRS